MSVRTLEWCDLFYYLRGKHGAGFIWGIVLVEVVKAQRELSTAR